MTVHQRIGNSQPAGYYGLKLDEELEKKVTSFNEVVLAQTNADIASYLNERIYEDKTDVELYSAYLCVQHEFMIQNFTNAELINFQRWICNRLAFLHTPEQEAST